MKVKSESEVAQSCPTLSDPMDYSLPGSSLHGIFKARVLEWGAIAFSIGRVRGGASACGWLPPASLTLLCRGRLRAQPLLPRTVRGAEAVAPFPLASQEISTPHRSTLRETAFRHLLPDQETPDP